MKLKAFIQRFIVMLMAFFMPIILFGQTQYDYYDDDAVFGGTDRALQGMLLFGVIIVAAVAILLILYVISKIYFFFNPKADATYKRELASKDKVKPSISVSDQVDIAIPEETSTLNKINESIAVDLNEDEINALLYPSKKEEAESLHDNNCKYGLACYTSDYKKFIKLNLSIYYFNEYARPILEILEGTEVICSNAIYSDTLQQLVLPKSLLYIGNSSINCKSIKEINLPDTLHYIGDYAFDGCENIQEIIIPQNVAHIGYLAFPLKGLKKIINKSPKFKVIGDFLFDEDQRRLIKYFGSETKINIPDSVTDVTGAFAGCGDVESVALPNGLLSIGQRTFMDCSRLKNITIPNNVKEIGESAFEGCKSLEKIVIPEGVKIIRDWCFECCINLRYVVLPDSIELIEGDIFGLHHWGRECISLKHIFIPIGTKEKFLPYFSSELLIEGSPEDYYERQKREEISTPNSELKTTITKQDIQEGWSDEFGVRYSSDGRRLLYSTHRDGNIVCSSGVKEYKIKNGTVVICDNAFESGVLESIELPDSIEKIGSGVFSGCKNLKQINIPANIYYFGERAFSGCSSLKELSIPSGIKEIHDYSFYNCSSLRELKVPDSVEFIGTNAFGGCTKLQEITLPTSVKEIKGNPFGNTISTIHKQYQVFCKSQRYIIENDALYTSDKKTLIACLSNDTQFEVIEGVTKIGDCAFYENSLLKTIKLPSSLIEIGDKAFYGCYITRIQLPDSLRKIGDCAFGFCEQLSKITLSEGLEYLGKEAFCRCERISEIVLPKTLHKIEEESFFGCESLKSIKVLNPNIIIDNNVFSHLDSLERIEFNGCPSDVNDDLFCWSENLKEIIVPRGTKKNFCLLFPSKTDIIKIKNKTKENAEKKQIELSTAITDADKLDSWKDNWDVIYSKDRKKLLSCEYKVVVHTPLPFEDKYSYNRHIRNYYDLYDMDDSFYYEIIPGTEIICDRAFSRCESLIEINIPETVKAIGFRAFEDCKTLKRFVFPSDIKVIKEYCFIACPDLYSVTLPESLESIEKCAFVGCRKLKKIEIPNSVKTIGQSAFQSCGLEELKLSQNLEEISPLAFCNINIKELVIPQNVKVISRKAFLDCFNLKTVEFRGVDVECDNAAFVISADAEGNCYNMELDSIIVPKGAKTIFNVKLPQYQNIIIEKE